MHQVDVGRVVEAAVFRQQPGTGHEFFGALVAGFREQHLVRLFVDGEIARAVFLLDARQVGNDLIHAVVQFGAVFGLAGDDQRRPRLIDQDRVHLVDDRVGQATLHAFGCLEHHVVAQIIESELAIRAIGDVGSIGLLLQAVLHLRQVHAN